MDNTYYNMTNLMSRLIDFTRALLKFQVVLGGKPRQILIWLSPKSNPRVIQHNECCPDVSQRATISVIPTDETPMMAEGAYYLKAAGQFRVAIGRTRINWNCDLLKMIPNI